MATRRIRRDEHSIYIRLDGSLFRPQVTADSRRYDPTIKDTISRFRESDYVYAHLEADTPFARVDDEIWHDHGTSSWTDRTSGRIKQIDSKLLWEPMSRGPLTEDLLRQTLALAKGIAWDGCHKIYVLMDDEQVRLTRDEYGYGSGGGDSQFLLVGHSQADQELAFRTVKDWYERSCSLRFINGVRTHHSDPNAGFFTIVAQCDEWVDEVYAEV